MHKIYWRKKTTPEMSAVAAAAAAELLMNVLQQPINASGEKCLRQPTTTNSISTPATPPHSSPPKAIHLLRYLANSDYLIYYIYIYVCVCVNGLPGGRVIL